MSETPRLFRTDAPETPDRLIDVHLNVGATAAARYGRLAPADALSYADAAGVTQMCAFPPLAAGGYGAANAALAAWAATTGGRVRPFARLAGPHPRPVREPWQARQAIQARIERRAAEVPNLDGVAGVKMTPHLDGVPCDETLEEVSRRGLPAVIHAGVHVPPRWIEKTLLPKLRGPVIVAHLGAFPDWPAGLDQALALAARVERVWLDTSGVWMAAFLQEAARRVPEKLLFGSDAPLVHPLTAWLHTALAVRDDAVLERIAWRNAADALGDALTPQP